MNLPKLAKIMGCKLVRLSQPILLDLCLHPSINAFLQDGCRYLLSIFKCSTAQKHSKILFLLFSSGVFSSLSWTRPFDFSPVTKQFWKIKEVKIIFTWHFFVDIVFCYPNCSDLLWEKIVLVIEKNFWNLRLNAENFQNFWDHYNNLFEQWKVRTICGNRMLF